MAEEVESPAGDRIHELPDSVSDQIAAGEVVERPASVVKELVENALDAGADRIDIEFEEGGSKRIVVRDDGEGIARDDLPLALRRHATSKITSAEDLVALDSLGFRGEALASIASVARVEIVSRREDAPEAYRIVRPPSGEPAVEPTARKTGTTVIVEDLFENVPARKKFLKTEATERKHIIRECHRTVLAHPEVHISLRGDGNELLSVPPDELAVRLREILGEDVHEDLIRLEREEPDWKGQGRFYIHGLLSGGENTRRTRRHQYCFVNGRPIQDPVLYRAISRAYEELLRDDRHPLVVLFLEVPRGFLDVNVHPRKEEVRYDQPSAVFEFVYRSIKQRLEDHFQSDVQTDWDRDQDPTTSGERDRSPRSPEHLLNQKSGSETGPESAVHGDLFTSSSKPETDGSRSRILGQFRDTFLVVEREGGLLLVDQHTGHEKILYEQFLREVEGKEPAQYLSVPLTLELSRDERETILEFAESLERLGLVLESFGSSSLVIQSVPSYLGRRSEDKRMVFDMIDEFLEWEESDRISQPAEDMITIMSCRSAVMRGDRLMPQEQEELIRGLNDLQFPRNCPHGRRIYREIGNDQIARWFERPRNDLCTSGQS